MSARWARSFRLKPRSMRITFTPRPSEEASVADFTPGRILDHRTTMEPILVVPQSAREHPCPATQQCKQHRETKPRWGTRRFVGPGACSLFSMVWQWPCALLALLGMSQLRPMASSAAARTADVGVALILLLTIVLGFRNGQYTNSRRLSRFTDAGKLATYLLIAAAAVSLLAFVTKGFFFGSLEFSRLLVVASLAIFFADRRTGARDPGDPSAVPLHARAWLSARSWCWEPAKPLMTSSTF